MVLLIIAFIDYFQKTWALNQKVSFCFWPTKLGFGYSRFNTKHKLLKNPDTNATLIQLKPSEHIRKIVKLNGKLIFCGSKLIMQNSLWKTKLTTCLIFCWRSCKLQVLSLSTYHRYNQYIFKSSSKILFNAVRLTQRLSLARPHMGCISKYSFTDFCELTVLDKVHHTWETAHGYLAPNGSNWL